MHLYFLRHGEADWPDWKKSDDERPLTERGRKEMGKVADFLCSLEVKVDQIISSPLPRAKQTAEIVAKKLKIDIREDSLLEPGFDQSGLKRILQKFSEKNVMLVGHEPDFSELISALTGGSVKLSKAGLALVELESAKGNGRLLWLFPPRIAKARVR